MLRQRDGTSIKIMSTSEAPDSATFHGTTNAQVTSTRTLVILRQVSLTLGADFLTKHSASAADRDNIEAIFDLFPKKLLCNLFVRRLARIERLTALCDLLNCDFSQCAELNECGVWPAEVIY